MALTYILLLLISAVFHIMYKGDLSFVLLVFMLIFPIVILAMLIVSTLRLRVTAYCETPYTDRENPAAVKIAIRNRSPFPISHFAIGVQYKFLSPFEDCSVQKYELSAALGAGMNETLSLNFTPEHCGVLEIAVKNIKIHDLLGIFHTSRKIDLKEKITVQPQIQPVRADAADDMTVCDESGIFSQIKSGDDPSEIFSLREYREGDRPNCIHWKLSSRSGSFIVKELSQPIGRRILIIADFCGCNCSEDIDRVLDAAASLSAFLVEKGIVHTFAYACRDCNIHTAEITEEELIYAEMNRLAENLGQVELKSSFAYIASVSDGAFLKENAFSRITAVCAKVSGAYADELFQSCGEGRLTIICTDADSKHNSGSEVAEAEIIYADAEKLSVYPKEFEI